MIDDLSEEQRAFAESVRRFAEAHLAAGALARAHDPRFPFDVAEKLAKQGWLQRLQVLCHLCQCGGGSSLHWATGLR